MGLELLACCASPERRALECSAPEMHAPRLVPLSAARALRSAAICRLLPPAPLLPARSASAAACRLPPTPLVGARRHCATAATEQQLQPSPQRLRLELPFEIGPLALNAMRPNYGAKKNKRRLGQGVGSGRGRTATRGHKGKRARAGNHGFIKNDGGQTRLQKKLPKLGEWRPTLEYQPIRLSKIERAVKTGRLPEPSEGRPITVKELFDARLVTLRTRHAGVELVADGADRLQSPLHLEVQRADLDAIAAVERAGGTIETVYYNRVNLRALLKPHRFEAAPVGRRHGDMRPRPALPPPKLMRDVYLSEAYRGYLRNLPVGAVVRPHEHPAHVDQTLLKKPKYPGWEAAEQQAIARGTPYFARDGSVVVPDGPAEAPPRARDVLDRQLQPGDKRMGKRLPVAYAPPHMLEDARAARRSAPPPPLPEDRSGDNKD